MFFYVPTTHVTVSEKGLRFCLLSVLCLSPLLHKESEQQSAHTSKHEQDVRRMRTVIGALLVSGAAGLQLHKGIKLAAPALPVAALLPSAALAAADNYEYGSA